MPGRLFLNTPMSEIAAFVGEDAGPMASEPPRRNIQPGQEVVCLTSDGFTRMRWGIIPVGRVNARGRPVMETIINARSETVFDKSELIQCVSAQHLEKFLYIFFGSNDMNMGMVP